MKGFGEKEDVVGWLSYQIRRSELVRIINAPNPRL